jgi:hypothetical protein
MHAVENRWKEPIHRSASLLSGSESNWVKVVSELDAEIAEVSAIHPNFPFWRLRVWQRSDDGMVLAVVRKFGEREIWLLNFHCCLESSKRNEKAMMTKTELLIRKRLESLRSKSYSKMQIRRRR